MTSQMLNGRNEIVSNVPVIDVSYSHTYVLTCYPNTLCVTADYYFLNVSTG